MADLGTSIDFEAGLLERMSSACVCEDVPPSAEPPTISNITPEAGTTLEKNSAVGFDVSTARAVFLSAVYADTGEHEVIHNGEKFATRYIALSTRVALEGGGYRYNLRRSGGWPSTPGIQINAIE